MRRIEILLSLFLVAILVFSEQAQDIKFRDKLVDEIIKFGNEDSIQKGIWVKYQVKERMTNLQEQKARCLPNCSFNAKSDDRGMNFEFNYYSFVDRKNHIYRGHVSWTWQNMKGSGNLIPGEKVTIRGVVSNLSRESSGVSAFANFGTWKFTKPEPGKPDSASPNSTTVMIGTFEVPKQPGINRDGTPNPYLYLTFMLSGGNEQRFIERTIVYKWQTIN